jgi:lysophospholipase L1-like esterase
MVDFDRWHDAFEESKKIADKASKLDPLQLVMIGDSITEQWNGLSVGHPIAKYEGNAAVFQELFQMENGGKINAAALGISGDRVSSLLCAIFMVKLSMIRYMNLLIQTWASSFFLQAANLLYRIENGGMENLYPDIWWILIGTNDLSGDLCGEDAIVAANIAVVEEIRQLRPNATVVLNSILPRPSYLWEYLEPINERLQCYAALTEQVDYFDATRFFRFPNGTLRYLPDDLHPNAEGSRVWGEAIVDKVLELLEKR